MAIKKSEFYYASLLALSVLSVFIKGIIKINTQTIENFKTYSGGFPISWFEYYYPKDINLSLNYIVNNWSGYFKIDLFALLLNAIVIYLIVKFIFDVIIKKIKS